MLKIAGYSGLIAAGPSPHYVFFVLSHAMAVMDAISGNSGAKQRYNLFT
jgi:hypothetical protein